MALIRFIHSPLQTSFDMTITLLSFILLTSIKRTKFTTSAVRSVKWPPSIVNPSLKLPLTVDIMQMIAVEFAFENYTSINQAKIQFTPSGSSCGSSRPRKI